MTQRLTDDEIRALREMHAIATDRSLSAYKRMQAQAKVSDLMTWNGFDGGDGILPALLDEIEERRRIDARRLADAEQAFREECEAEEQKRKDFIAQRNDPSLDDYEKRASKFWGVDLRGRMKRVDGYLPSVPAGKDGGA
jgi:hypothetical protein